MTNVKKDDDLGEHSASTIGTTNSTSVAPTNTGTTAGKGRKKSLGKIYTFIEPSAPSTGLNYIINSIKGTTNSHAQQTQPATTLSNNISNQAKHTFLSSKTSNPLSTTGLTGSKKNRQPPTSSLGKYSSIFFFI